MFQYFLHLGNENANSDNRSLAHDTLDVILPFWRVARIKTLTRPSAMNRFMILHERHKRIVKNKGRDKKPEKKKRTDCLKDLDKLFYIGAIVVVEEIKTNRLLAKEAEEEDIDFYLDQQTTRQAHMSGHDKVFEKNSKEKGFREIREERMLLSVDVAAAEVGQILSDKDADYSQNTCNSEGLECTEIAPGCSSKPSTITIHFPRSIMTSEDICGTVYRLSLSDNHTTAIVSVVFKAGGADLNDFILSLRLQSEIG